MIDGGGTITLDAGDVIQTTGFIRIGSNVTITTDANNPATIRHVGTSSSWMFGILGENVTIENVILDWNMGGSWRQFCVLIGFSQPGFGGPLPGGLYPAPTETIRNTLIDNVTFINSGVETLHPNYSGENVPNGDCWCISLNCNENFPANTTPLQNVIIRNCTHLSPTTQLTANGWGAGGIDGLTICGNTIDRGHANSIAVSMAGGVGPRTHKNITITNNTINNALAIGIFVGRDGTDQVLEVALENIIITDNHIDHSPDFPQGTPPMGETPAVFVFPLGIALRATAGLDATSGIVIARNTIDVSDADNPNDPDYQAPRFLVLAGAGTYSQFDNTYIGTGSLDVSDWTEVPYEESGMDTMIGQYYQHVGA